jgi:hypothetical protein
VGFYTDTEFGRPMPGRSSPLGIHFSQFSLVSGATGLLHRHRDKHSQEFRPRRLVRRRSVLAHSTALFDLLSHIGFRFITISALGRIWASRSDVTVRRLWPAGVFNYHFLPNLRRSVGPGASPGSVSSRVGVRTLGSLARVPIRGNPIVYGNRRMQQKPL